MTFVLIPSSRVTVLLGPALFRVLLVVVDNMDVFHLRNLCAANCVVKCPINRVFALGEYEFKYL